MDALLREAAALLDQLRSKRWREGRHLSTCRIGQWVDGYGYPDGAPCSTKCAAVARIVDAVAQREAAEQAPLFEVEA